MGQIRDADRAVDLFQGKWRVAILYAMREKPVRIGQLTRKIPDASKKALIDNLKALVGAGLVVRRDLGGGIRHVEYDLEEEMKDATYELLDQLASWGSSFERAGFGKHANSARTKR